jgi:hypothetical protein
MADEENELMTEIVRLQRQVSVLTEIVEHLFTLTGSVQRFTDASEEAHKEIPLLLKHLKNPDV